jgi:hypothetical protein
MTRTINETIIRRLDFVTELSYGVGEKQAIQPLPPSVLSVQDLGHTKADSLRDLDRASSNKAKERA